jgi:hypothetical protein
MRAACGATRGSRGWQVRPDLSLQRGRDVVVVAITLERKVRRAGWACAHTSVLTSASQFVP